MSETKAADPASKASKPEPANANAMPSNKRKAGEAPDDDKSAKRAKYDHKPMLHQFIDDRVRPEDDETTVLQAFKDTLEKLQTKQPTKRDYLLTVLVTSTKLFWAIEALMKTYEPFESGPISQNNPMPKNEWVRGQSVRMAFGQLGKTFIVLVQAKEKSLWLTLLRAQDYDMHALMVDDQIKVRSDDVKTATVFSAATGDFFYRGEKRCMWIDEVPFKSFKDVPRLTVGCATSAPDKVRVSSSSGAVEMAEIEPAHGMIRWYIGVTPGEGSTEALAAKVKDFCMETIPRMHRG